jgi:hypothetical protein
MSDLQKALETTEATIEALQSYAENIRNRMQPVNGAKCKQWSPVGGSWFINDEGFIFNSPSTQLMKEFGHERPTQQQAERTLIEMRKFNRLLALRDELCGDDVVDWSKGDPKYSLCWYEENKTWYVNTSFRQNNSVVYFTTKEHAQRACDTLSNGEVEL